MATPVPDAGVPVGDRYRLAIGDDVGERIVLSAAREGRAANTMSVRPARHWIESCRAVPSGPLLDDAVAITTGE